MPQSRYDNLIDACVFLEPILKGPYKEECLKCINRAGKTYNGTTLNLCLGEIFTRMIEKNVDLPTILKYFDRVLKKGKFKILRIDSRSLEISKQLRMNSWFCNKIQDSIIIGNVISHDLDGFITIDDELLKCDDINQKVSKKFIKRKISLFHVENFPKM